MSKKMSAEVFDFSHNCDHEWVSHPNWYQSVELSSLYHDTNLKETGLTMPEHKPT